jgi:mobilization protein NikA
MAKTRAISARVTEAEYSALQSNAWAHGKTMGDWARDCLLLRLQTGSGGHMEQHLFTELVGIQLLLMNTLGQMLCGERLSAEQLDAVLRQVQSAKARKAQELLNKRLGLRDRSRVTDSAHSNSDPLANRRLRFAENGASGQRTRQGVPSARSARPLTEPLTAF